HGYRIFINNLDHTTTNEDLTTKLASFGNIVSCNVVNKNGKTTGSAIFQDHESYKKALSKSHIINGQNDLEIYPYKKRESHKDNKPNKFSKINDPRTAYREGFQAGHTVGYQQGFQQGLNNAGNPNSTHVVNSQINV
ncbi:MAG: hypothetical protein Homavirus38_6, partial [Homavirus sp.]